MKVILVGASKKARLVLDFLKQEGSSDQVIGFVDRNSTMWNTTFCERPVFGSLEMMMKTSSPSDIAFCICLSERFFADRAVIVGLLDSHSFVAKSLISTSASVSSTATIADGTILFPAVSVGMHTRVGTCVTVYTGALIEHDCTIEANVEIGPRAVLAGGVTVASSAFIGINATVLPHLKIGEGAMVGGGAVVTKDVHERTVVVGNPAHILYDPLR